MADPFSALTSLKSAYEIVRTMKGMMDEAKVNEVRIALQEALLEAQDRIRDARDEIDNKNLEITALKSTIAGFNDWSVEQEKWTLTQVGPSVFVYVHKDRVGTFDSEVKLCPNCFEKRIKSVLQNSPNMVRRGVTLVCQNKCPEVSFTYFLASNVTPRA